MMDYSSGKNFPRVFLFGYQKMSVNDVKTSAYKKKEMSFIVL